MGVDVLFHLPRSGVARSGNVAAGASTRRRSSRRAATGFSPCIGATWSWLVLPCQEVARCAKIIKPTSERTSDVVAFHLTLNVVPSMSRPPVAAVIVRCGQSISAEHAIEFTPLAAAIFVEI